MADSFLDIRTAVISNTGRSDRTAYINSAINKAIATYSRIWAWKGMQTISPIMINAGDSSFPLPTNVQSFQQAYLINGTNSYAIEIKNKTFLLQKWPNIPTSGAGLPMVGYIGGNVLYFGPKSNASYTVNLHYYAVIPALVADTDTIGIANLDLAVEAYATSKVFKSVEQFDSGAEWDKIAASEYATARDADARNGGQFDVAQMTGSRGMISGDPQHDPFVFSNRSGGNGW